LYSLLPLDEKWDALIADLPGAHLLQTAEWAQVKTEVGWKSYPLAWCDEQQKVIGAALVLVRTMKPGGIGPGISIGYIPRGPMLDWSNVSLRRQVIADIQEFSRKNHILFMKIDPEMRLGTGVPGREDAWEDPVGQQAVQQLKDAGWCYSSSQVQFKNTALLSLEGTEEDWLKRMKQKTRYNLRLAERNGVNIRIASEVEFPQIYKMYAETSVRDGFVIRSENYYLNVWKIFHDRGMLSPLIAEVEGQPVAGLMLFTFGKSAWYLYGMSTALHREKMPNYLLQWEAMRVAKNKGCQVYDLWGAPDVFDESDSMFGVFRFKDGLGASVLRTCGAWDYVVNHPGYFLYQQILPKVLSILRRNRNQETRQEIGA
jgi:lipid II:glycine glycyltransferase (peptidoglycan interpeptide bridge formation enzyme)